jgi:hypothetical protein
MVQGSFYWLRRKCGNPHCHCAQGELHGSWVITRSQAAQRHTYSVADQDRAQLRRLTAEYRRYQRARAVLVKRHLKILALADQMAQKRLMNWPKQKL